jgi:TPR repeat protein
MAIMYGVALFYEKGVGVTRDLNKAKEWYTRSADKLNAPPSAELDDEKITQILYIQKYNYYSSHSFSL